MIARNANPPTAPPTIAPIGVDESDCAAMDVADVI